MLCATCLSIFFNGALIGWHHKDKPSLIAAAEKGCRICYHIESTLTDEPLALFQYAINWEKDNFGHYRLVIRAGSEEDESVSGAEWQFYVDVSTVDRAPSGYEQFASLAAADLGSDPCRVRTEFPPLRDIPDNTGHEDVAKLAKKWLESCKAHHQCEHECAQEDTQWYPKRLIEVGSPEQPPRLVSREDDQLQGPYAALSHCWGENPNFLILNTNMVDSFHKGIPMDQLPASFRDVIITCRRLGIPYIWIDSLCIIQDSHSDWLFHSEEMYKVYLNCELNIAIDASSNPTEGAFRQRDPIFFQDCCVWTPYFAPQHRNEQFSPSKEEFLSPDGMNLCEVYTQHDFSWAREDHPLTHRAWVFQERLLSPRTLYFSSDRISWECGVKAALTEYLHKDSRDRGFDVLFCAQYNVRKNGTLHHFYDDLVDAYMDRDLTYPVADKLVAFAAVAKRCAPWFGGDYCAGIFRETLPWGLLWESGALAGTRRSQTWRAPSWSWASMDTRVRGDRIPLELGTDLARVEDVSVELVDPNNQFGQVKSASLTLTGPMVSVEVLMRGNGEAVQENLPASLPLENCTTAFGYHFRFSCDDDEGNSSEEWLSSQQNFFFLAIGESQHSKSAGLDGPRSYGLILQAREDDKCVRRGYWDARFGFVDNHAQTAGEFKTQTITIL